MTQLVRKYTKTEAISYIRGQINKEQWAITYHGLELVKAIKKNKFSLFGNSWKQNYHAEKLEPYLKKIDELESMLSKVCSSYTDEIYLSDFDC